MNDHAGPSRELKDWLITTWSEAHDGNHPSWADNKAAWILAARVHKQLGEPEVRRRWLLFLRESPKDWTGWSGHRFTVFVSQIDRWVPHGSPRPATKYQPDATLLRGCIQKARARGDERAARGYERELRILEGDD